MSINFPRLEAPRQQFYIGPEMRYPAQPIAIFRVENMYGRDHTSHDAGGRTMYWNHSWLWTAFKFSQGSLGGRLRDKIEANGTNFANVSAHCTVTSVA